MILVPMYLQKDNSDYYEHIYGFVYEHYEISIGQFSKKLQCSSISKSTIANNDRTKRKPKRNHQFDTDCIWN